MKASPHQTSGQAPESISDRDFSEIVRIALEVSGIFIDDSKRPMIYSRFSRRLRELNLDTFEQYIDRLKHGDQDEYTAFINTVTTNLTYFFREPHHFEFLRKTAIPALVQRNASDRKIRLWSSACSSGQEAYSMAMVAAETAQLTDWHTRILATDIDTEMVEACSAGIYAEDTLRGLPPQQQTQWMQQCNEGRLQFKDKLRDMLLTKQLNLFSNWPFRPGIDAIFCRNALIYFDEAHQHKLLSKFADFQTPGSYLFLGHSESIKGNTFPYKRVSNTVYERL